MKIAATLPKNHRFYALLAGNLVILALIGLFVVRPVVGLLVRHTTEIVRTKSDVAFLQQKTAELKKLKTEYPVYEQTYAPLLAALPKTKDVAGYQTELEDLAKLTSNTLQTVDTSGTASAKAGGASPSSGASQGATAPTTAGGFPSIPVKVTLHGTFATVLDFMHRLETMDRFTKVAGMKLKADQSGAVSADLDLQTIYFGGAAT